MCYLPPAPALWMCLGALVGKATFTASTPRTGHGSSGHRLREPILVQGPCQPAGVLGLSVVRQQEQRLFPGRPLRQADHRIRLLSNPRLAQWGKPSCRPHPRELNLGAVSHRSSNARRATCSASRRTEYDQLSMATGKQLGQPPDFSMISPPELQPATTMTLEIDPQVRYQQNPSEAAQHAAVRAMVDYVVAAASWAAVMDKTSLLESPKAPR
jgi:hypothetical protein